MPKTKKRKFYRTVFVIEVLSEDQIPPHIELETVANEIGRGGWSGEFYVKTTEEVSGKKMAKMLIEQGSDPSFFQLTEDGKDADV